MKKILLLIFALFIIVSPHQVFAQEDTNGPSFEYFNVEVITKGQSAWNKNVPIYVKFIATIDSDKVQITWDTPYGIDIIPKHPKFVTVKAGKTYQYKAEIKPKIAGSYNIAANVVAWQNNNNYTSSGNTSVRFAETLLTDPISSSYQIGVVIKWLVVILVLVILGFLGYIYALKSKKKFDKWFNLPD